MAIDTREKRFSMLNFGDGNHWHATFEADGAVDGDDRQHLLDCYSGIAFASAVPVVVVGKGRPRVTFIDRAAVLRFATLTIPDPIVEARPLKRPEFIETGVAATPEALELGTPTISEVAPANARAMLSAELRIPPPALTLSHDEMIAVNLFLKDL